MLPSKVYDILKWFTLIFLPAFTAFYGVFGATLNIPYVQETLTILAAFTTFLGALLGISSSTYNKNKEGEDVDN